MSTFVRIPTQKVELKTTLTPTKPSNTRVLLVNSATEEDFDLSENTSHIKGLLKRNSLILALESV